MFSGFYQKSSDALRAQRVLVIDDSPSIHDDFARILCPDRLEVSGLLELEAAAFGQSDASAPRDAPSFRADFALQGEQGCQMVADAIAAGDPYLMAFVDMRMPPGWDGVETIQHLWKVDPNLHVVICTAYSDYSWSQVVGILGYTDRLLLLRKPFDIAEVWQMACAMTRKRQMHLEIARQLADSVNLSREMEEANNLLQKEIASRSSAEANIRQLAYHDALTGLPNRLYLSEKLQECFDRFQADEHATFAILFMDLDNFKLINDSLGHDHGDRLLVLVAQRIKACIRSLDFLARIDDEPAARIGGDEFVVVLRGLHRASDAAIAATRFLQALASPFQVGEHEIGVSASVGIAVSNPNYRGIDPMLRDADTAMYRAKSEGRSRYAIFDPDMHQLVQDRLQLETDLRRAIDHSEFVLYYQPIVTLPGAAVHSFEALIRWNHPRLGLIGPSRFVASAEENGTIIPIGIMMLRMACRQFVEWTRRFPGMRNVSLSVNLSARQLREARLTEEIRQILVETTLAPERLCLEITETYLIQELDKAALQLQSLCDLGVSIHMDDFGTGYSSLSNLHRFPLSAVKVDREFTSTMYSNPTYGAVIQAIVTLAHELGLKVIVEGVEHASQAVRLAAVGCDYAQGYYYSKPLPPDDVVRLLEGLSMRARAETVAAQPSLQGS